MFRDGPKLILEDAEAPSATFAVFVQMEDLLEKLKILNHDVEFIQDLRMKPISR